jgi:predicted HicB family RNase H-like nuclease
MNILTIDNHRAVITYDPDTDMLRGEFLGLNGGADFYASDIPTLKAHVPGGFP